jgi:hypothetical protein
VPVSFSVSARLCEQCVLSKLQTTSFRDQEDVVCFNELSYDMYIVRKGSAKLWLQDNESNKVIFASTHNLLLLFLSPSCLKQVPKSSSPFVHLVVLPFTFKFF